MLDGNLKVVSFAVLMVAVWLAGSAALAQDRLDIPIVYVTLERDEAPPLSLVEPIIEDKGLGGVGKGIEDNATTGRFINHHYDLVDLTVPEDGDVEAAVAAEIAAGRRFFVVDLDGASLLRLADLPGAADTLMFNIRAQDDHLRRQDCRPNVMHVMPSRAMKTDGLAQYLVKKKWREWFLVHGTGPGDLAYVAALERAAKRFGAKIVEKRAYEYEPGARRSDTGHAQTQKQMAVFTQEADDHDVVVVADESDVFGEYLPYRVWDPRPVVGTQGLVPTAWHRSHEQWGGTQMQRRFRKFAGRIMTERDFNGWVAVRTMRRKRRPGQQSNLERPHNTNAIVVMIIVSRPGIEPLQPAMQRRDAVAICITAQESAQRAVGRWRRH